MVVSNPEIMQNCVFNGHVWWGLCIGTSFFWSTLYTLLISWPKIMQNNGVKPENYEKTRLHIDCFATRPWEMQNASLGRYCELGRKAWNDQKLWCHVALGYEVSAKILTRELVILWFIENNDCFGVMGRLVCNSCSGGRVCMVVLVDGLALVDYNRDRFYHVLREKSCRIVVSLRVVGQHRWKSENAIRKTICFAFRVCVCVLLVNRSPWSTGCVPLI